MLGTQIRMAGPDMIERYELQPCAKPTIDGINNQTRKSMLNATVKLILTYESILHPFSSPAVGEDRQPRRAPHGQLWSS